MNKEELDNYLEKNEDIEWMFDKDDILYLRHTVFDKDGESTKIEPKAFKELTPEKLNNILVGGRNINQITRVTGYFSIVSNWNKGKTGELKDRKRETKPF